MLWSNVAFSQVAVLWQSVQSWGKPAAVWFGLLVHFQSFMWQDTQSVDRVAYCPLAWQAEHC